ncbi:MAG TPA: arginine deiminase-related protein [Caulobacteraceae bacterium]|nr:arginine deiminase-related protein [Caulobacteraceae bacterium]
MSDKPLILMTSPDWFDVSYVINPWMRPSAWRENPERLQRASHAAHNALKTALRDAGAAVRLIQGAPGLPDMVFPANAAVVLDRRALLGRFRPPERRGEEPRFAAAFEALLREAVVDQVSRLPAGCFQEGAGDCIWDAGRGHFWAGWGQRSAREAVPAIAEFFGRDVVALELASPRFYHLDTCFCPLSGGEVLYYPPAFTPDALREIHRRVPAPQRIAAADEDAARLCVNAVCLDRTLAMAAPSPALRAELQSRGYRVAGLDLSPFVLAGGAAFCMTLRLDQTAAPALIADSMEISA